MPRKTNGLSKGGVQSFSGLEQLFGSRTRFNLLKLFCADEEQKFFVRELARMIDGQLNAVRREVSNLVELGIIREVQEIMDPKKKFYKLNKNFILIDQINALVQRSDLLAEKKLVDHISEIGHIELCILTGGLIGSAEKPCDMLLVGSVNKKLLEKAITKFEEETKKSIVYAVFTPEEYIQRKALTDKFIFTVLEGKKMVAIDLHGEFANETE